MPTSLARSPRPIRVLIARCHLPRSPLHLVALVIHLQPTAIASSTSLIARERYKVIVSRRVVIPLSIWLALELLTIVLLLIIHVLVLLLRLL